MLILEVVITGVLLGGLYACMAMGFSVIWGVTNLINLAHGSLIIIGAYITWTLVTHFGIDPFLTLPISAGALFVIGYLLQRLLLNRVLQSSLFLTLILTFGLNMVLVNVNLALFSASARSITMPYADAALDVGGIQVPYTRLAVFVIALLLTYALHLFMNRTTIGNAIRATAQHARAASLLGIEPRRIYALSFGLGAAMAGGAGTLMADPVLVFAGERRQLDPEVVRYRRPWRPGQHTGRDRRGDPPRGGRKHCLRPLGARVARRGQLRLAAAHSAAPATRTVRKALPCRRQALSRAPAHRDYPARAGVRCRPAPR